MINAETGVYLKNRAWFGVIAVLCGLVFYGASFIQDVKAYKKHVETHPARLAAYNENLRKQEVLNAVVEQKLKVLEKCAEDTNRQLKEINKHLGRLQLITNKGVKNAEKKREKTS